MNTRIAFTSCLFILLAACSVPPGDRTSTATPADPGGAPVSTTAPATPVNSPTVPVSTPTPIQTEPTEAADALPDRFAACVEMEPEVQRPLRWIYTDAGDLWVWDEGVEPISLTGSGDVLDFAVLPGGDQIVFSRGAAGGPVSVWVSGPDGAGLGAVDTGAGAGLNGEAVFHGFSSDGGYLAFTNQFAGGTGELWVLDLAARRAQRLVDQAALMEIITEPLATGARPAGVTWIPGTDRLTFDAYPTFDNDGIYIYVQRQVWSVDAAGGEIIELFPEGQGGSVSYSPNGSWMLLTDPDGIRLAQVSTGELIPLDVPYRQIGFGEFYAAPALAWAGGSDRFYVALPDESADPYTAVHPVTVWEVPVDGTPASPNLSLSGFFPSFIFSTDARLVAFWSAASQDANDRALHIAEVNGGAHIEYDTGGLIEFFGWSPFDRYFAYGDRERGGAFIGDLCADPVPLAHDPFNLRWLDAGRFVYEVPDVDAGRLEVYLGGLFTEAEIRFNLDAGSRVEVFLIQ